MKKSIIFSTGEFKVEKTSAWLVSFLKFAEQINGFEPLKSVQVKMKEVKYTVQQKLITLICSIATGCAYTSDVNDKLVPDTVAPKMLDMLRFPDQSQLNVLLREFSVGIDELEVTQRYRDGNIDLKGVRKGLDLLTDLDSVNYYIQAKLYNPSSTVSIKDVRALRGVMPNGYKGIFITTGKFSNNALEFGRNDNARPIIFIDGKKLIQSCVDNNLGFKSKPVFDSKILDDILEEENLVENKMDEKSKKNMKNAIKKKISVNNVRAKILPIPNTIFEKIPKNLQSC